MARTSTYLNFKRETEAAFNFYKSIFGGEFTRGGIARMGDVPTAPGQPPLSDEDKNLVMHVELAVTGGHVLMGTDAPESMGFKVNFGNNVYINLEPDTRAEAERLFTALSEGGKVGMPLQDMFWGAYFGSCTDKFGVQWMVNCDSHLSESERTITVSTTVKASPSEVWEKWTKPEHIMKWNQASQDWECPHAENDVRVGGKFSVRMQAKDGSSGFEFGGTYTNVVPESSLSYTLEDGRKVSVTFMGKSDGVHIIETFEMEHENPREMQEQGWQSILNSFKAYVMLST